MHQPSLRVLALVWSAFALVALWLPWVTAFPQVSEGGARIDLDLDSFSWPDQTTAWHLHRDAIIGAGSTVPLAIQLIVIVATIMVAAGAAFAALYCLEEPRWSRIVRIAAVAAAWTCSVLGLWVHHRLHHVSNGQYDSGLLPQFGLWVWQVSMLFAALALSGLRDESSRGSGFVIGPSLLDRR